MTSARSQSWNPEELHLSTVDYAGLYFKLYVARLDGNRKPTLLAAMKAA